MAQLIHGLNAEAIRANLAEVEAEIAAAARRAGRDPAAVEVCAATKYVPVGELQTLAQAGVTLVGENRAQDLEAKVHEHGPAFTWDFIGHVQSRKVRAILARTRLIHSVASDSVLEQLRRHADEHTKVLVEVNTSGERSKSGVAPDELGRFIERCPVTVAGLMTMPPLAAHPEDSRPYFAALRALADQHGLSRLSMGTTQDFAIGVEEGATIVRIGTRLYGSGRGGGREGA